MIAKRRSGLAIERGSDVAAHGRRFVITHVLDLDSVVAQEIDTGLSKRLLIADLRDIEDDDEVVVVTPDLTQLDGEDWDEARRRFALIKPFLAQSRTVRTEVDAAANPLVSRRRRSTAGCETTDRSKNYHRCFLRALMEAVENHVSLPRWKRSSPSRLKTSI